MPDTFTDSGVEITVEAFQWGNGQWTTGGYAEVTERGLAGGSGQEMWINNVNLDFKFPSCSLADLTLNFGEYGGNLNIDINGEFVDFDNFADIDGQTIGGADIAVVDGLGNDTGSVKLTGIVNSFAIGGQELAIDDVCPCAE